MIIKSVDGALLKIEGDNAVILVDPVQEAISKNKGDIVLTSNEKLKKIKASDDFKLFDWPGEYEAKGVLVHSVAHGTGASELRSQSLEVDGVRICVMAGVKEVPNKKKIAEFGNVDVLVVSTEMKASDMMVVIEEVDPYKVVLLNKYNSGDPEWANLQELLKEIGKTDAESISELSIKSKESLGLETLDYVVIDC